MPETEPRGFEFGLAGVRAEISTQPPEDARAKNSLPSESGHFLRSEPQSWSQSPKLLRERKRAKFVMAGVTQDLLTVH